MTFRKGDIVEVINEEHFYSREYPVGTTWTVARDQESGYYQVYVYDSNQTDRGGQAIFWAYNLQLIKRAEKVEGEKEMKFKKDDIVEVTEVDNCNGIEYPVGTQLRVIKDQKPDAWVVHVYDSKQEPNGKATLWDYNLKLVKRDEDELGVKIGDKVYGKNTHNEDWLAGEALDESRPWGYLVKVLNADYQYAWLENDTVKLLLEDTSKQDTPLEEPTAYTQEEINQLIKQAYQQFDNDSQRLAYLQGYFVK